MFQKLEIIKNFFTNLSDIRKPLMPPPLRGETKEKEMHKFQFSHENINLYCCTCLIVLSLFFFSPHVSPSRRGGADIVYRGRRGLLRAVKLHEVQVKCGRAAVK